MGRTAHDRERETEREIEIPRGEEIERSKKGEVMERVKGKQASLGSPLVQDMENKSRCEGNVAAAVHVCEKRCIDSRSVCAQHDMGTDQRENTTATSQDKVGVAPIDQHFVLAAITA